MTLTTDQIIQARAGLVPATDGKFQAKGISSDYLRERRDGLNSILDRELGQVTVKQTEFKTDVFAGIGDHELTQGTRRPSFPERMRVMQKNYTQLRTSVQEPHDRMPAITELEDGLEKKRKGLLNKCLRKVEAVRETVYVYVREAPGVIQAPFNTVSRGLFCCIKINTNYEN